ncbi:hypothetical protein QR680_014814 [Steinernema hermaphroditum]|uniref:DDE Tnp4 domain-containing protein n=1 Tax=Steinernema hermaphroditum TaxID=289476 RepID=A0AA39ICD8_9BILA|nr:hypothetical protein QR680_014814 [Steinernema hermaphroditum]
MDSEDELAAVLLLATGGLGRRTRKYVREAHDDNQNLRFARFRLYDNFGEAELEAYVRLKPNMFEMLLRRIGPQLARSRTHRYPLDPQKRLIVFLRYLTTGLTFSHLAQEVGIGTSTVSEVIQQASEAFASIVYEQIRWPCPAQFEDISREFYEKWNFPYCLGALDGKHFRVECPSKSGASYYCYKYFYSIIMLALVDANYRFIWVDIGGEGRSGDAQLYNSSSLSNRLREMRLFGSLGRYGQVPYVVVADGGFPIQPRLLRPFGAAACRSNLTARYFNKRLSRARQVSEHAFGILTRRFTLFDRPLLCSPETAKKVVFVAIILHNFLRNQTIDDSDEVVDGIPEDQIEDEEDNETQSSTSSETALREGESVREKFRQYFNSSLGFVPL